MLLATRDHESIYKDCGAKKAGPSVRQPKTSALAWCADRPYGYGSEVRLVEPSIMDGSLSYGWRAFASTDPVLRLPDEPDGRGPATVAQPPKIPSTQEERTASTGRTAATAHGWCWWSRTGYAFASWLMGVAPRGLALQPTAPKQRPSPMNNNSRQSTRSNAGSGVRKSGRVGTSRRVAISGFRHHEKSCA
jgi:hypothetical protein